VINHEATAAVPLVDLALDGVGYVTRRRCFRLFCRSRSRVPPRGEALLLHLLDQQVERLLEDCRHVSVRNSVAEQILRLAEFIVTRASRRELELEGVFGERRRGPSFIASRR
jgi:hypothetical protein